MDVHEAGGKAWAGLNKAERSEVARQRAAKRKEYRRFRMLHVLSVAGVTLNDSALEELFAVSGNARENVT